MKKICISCLFILLIFQINTFAITKKEAINQYKNQLEVYLDKGIFPVLGTPGAKVKIHVFFDPLCFHCREVDKILNNLLKDPQYKDKIAVYRHLFVLRPGEDYQAGLLIVEMIQRHLYEPFSEQVLKKEIFDFPSMLKLANSLAKTTITKDSLKKNEATLRQEQDFAEKSKKLNFTPAVFINNKFLGENFRIIKDIIDDILAH